MILFKHLPLSESLARELSKCEKPTPLGFGKFILPIMVECRYQDGRWSEPTLTQQEQMSLSPLAGGLHYGQLIFEGMKAFRNLSGQVFLFRPLDHWNRFNQSAEFMSMPPIDLERFMIGLESLVYCAKNLIPVEPGSSLYIRPFMIASEPRLSVSSCEEFRFMIVASPSTGFFSSPLKVMIERELTRTAPGGTGRVKCAGNYAPTFRITQKAIQAGYDQVLWLDAHQKRYVEELSAMNFFYIDSQSCLVTPPLSDTILAGITRDSILTFAPALGLQTREEAIDIDQLCEEISSGKVQEAFSCGTGAIVAMIECLGEANGKRYSLKISPNSVSNRIRNFLLNIQSGGEPHTQFNWIWPIPMR